MLRISAEPAKHLRLQGKILQMMRTTGLLGCGDAGTVDMDVGVGVGGWQMILFYDVLPIQEWTQMIRNMFKMSQQ